jgi:hypothetical protein
LWSITISADFLFLSSSFLHFFTLPSSVSLGPT